MNEDKELISELIDLYDNTGKIIAQEVSNLKAKMDFPRGLQVTDLEKMLEKLDICNSTLGLIGDKIHELLTNRKDSI